MADKAKKRLFIGLVMGTNGLLVEKRFHEFSPTPYLTFNVHLDGLDKHHDHAVCHSKSNI